MFNLTVSNARTNFPLSPKKIIKKTISKAMTLPWIYLFMGIFFAPAYPLLRNIFGTSTIPMLIIFILILFLLNVLWTYIYEGWYFNTYFYELTESFIVIRKGVFSNQEITIPYDRIQDVYVDQDIIDRFFGLYDVHLSSATMSSSWLAHIDGVEQAAADGLKQALLQKLQRGQTSNGNKIA